MHRGLFAAAQVALLVIVSSTGACSNGGVQGERGSASADDADEPMVDVRDAGEEPAESEEDAADPDDSDAGGGPNDAGAVDMERGDAGQADAHVVMDAEVAAPDAANIVVAVTGQWLLYEAPDRNGTDWSGSTLELTAARTDAGMDKNALEGRFVWRSSGNYRGDELVRGTFAPTTSQLVLDGYMLVNPQSIVRSHYTASYDRTKDEIVGVWTVGVPGNWKARRTTLDGGVSAPR